MHFTIHLFARARELAGAGEVRVELPAAATVGDLRAVLADRYPLRDLLAVSRIAVNHDFASDSTELKSSDEIAVIPPVSGG